MGGAHKLQQVLVKELTLDGHFHLVKRVFQDIIGVQIINSGGSCVNVAANANNSRCVRRSKQLVDIRCVALRHDDKFGASEGLEAVYIKCISLQELNARALRCRG